MGKGREWVSAGLPAATYEMLAAEVPASRLWSLLLEVLRARAARRDTAAIADQFERDRFVRPAPIDQRTFLDIDVHLFDAAKSFEAIELSPVAPLGVASVMAGTGQNRVLSALRGTEVVSDPTNVLALACARRLRRDPSRDVRLATTHRCVRAQPVPKGSGFAAHFRIFCLATAGIERQNHAFIVDAVAEHVRVMLAALDRLEQRGFAFGDRCFTVLATPERAALGDRIAEAAGVPRTDRHVLEHPYYDGGLRYQISARSAEGRVVPLIDGGAFRWVAQLSSNRRAVYVASGLGTQLVPVLFRRTDA